MAPPIPTSPGLAGAGHFSGMTTLGQSILHYQILGPLGAGGMGVVYRANDTRLDRSVALKFLPEAHSLDPGAKERLRVEAQAAARLDHPNIGVIYNIEEADDRLFIVMALYQGESLKERLDQGPLSVPEALDICLQSARGLARAHEAGIVHRDIKPANLFLTQDGLVKILDFGLVKRAEVQGLTQTGAILGTPEYMAPEQIRGQAVDARTDLWALGVVLYEMLTGVSPFRAEGGLAATVFQVMSKEPTPAGELQPGLPAEIQPLLDRALAKDRDERYASAEELIADLEEAVAGVGQEPSQAGYPAQSRPSGPAGPHSSDPTRAGGEERRAGTPGPISIEDLTLERAGTSLASPFLEAVPDVSDFVGRETELAALAERLERDRLIVIKGMAGVGKSALGSRLARAQGAEEQIFWFTFDPVDKNTVDSLFWSLAAFLRGRDEPLLWRYLQGEIEAHQPLDKTVKLNLLLSSLASADYLLCFDDLHLVADEADITELFKLLQKQVSARRQELSARFILMGREVPRDLEHLVAEPLRGLSQDEASSLLRARGLQLPAELATQLRERTQGNPTLLELAASALSRMGDDAGAMATFIGTMAERSDIRDYILNHVYAALRDEEKKIVDTLSIFPVPVELEAAEETLADEGLRGIVQTIDALVQKSVVNETEDGRVYCHNLVREFCYRALDRRDRRRLHGCAAEYYEDKKNILAAAYHHFEQGDQEKALTLLTGNLRSVIDRGGAAALLEQLDRFDTSSLAPEQQLAVSLTRGEALYVRGEFRQAVALYQDTLDDVVEDADQAELLCRIGSALDRLGDDQRAIDFSMQALHLYEDLADETGVARIHNAVGWAHYSLGHLDQAEAAFAAGRELAESLGDKSLFAKTNQGLGMIGAREGRFEEARQRLEESRRIFRELRDRTGEARTMGDLAWVHGLLGSPDRELTFYRKVLEILEDIGDVGNLLLLYNNLGDLHHRSGDFAEAITHYEKLADLARRVKHDSLLSCAKAGLADNYLALGDLQAALEHAQESERIARSLDHVKGEGVELGVSSRVLGEVYMAMEDPAEARKWFEKSIPLLEEAREVEELASAKRGHAAAVARIQGDPSLVKRGSSDEDANQPVASGPRR